MAIENGNYVKLSYTGSVNGAPFDTTDAEEAKKAGMEKSSFFLPAACFSRARSSGEEKRENGRFSLIMPSW